MDIDEKLFHFFWKTKKKFEKQKISNSACLLKENKEKFTFIACAFFGKTIHIKEAEKDGGLIGNSLFLPKFIHFFETQDLNYQLYLFKIIYSATAYIRGHHFKYDAFSKIQHELISLIVFPTILSEVRSEYPKFEELLSHVIAKMHVPKGTSDFFQTWQIASLDEQTNLNEKYNELIREFIRNKNHTPESAVDALNDLVKRLKINGIDYKNEMEFFPLYSKLPTTAQTLTIKKGENSEISEGTSEEEKTLKASKSKEKINFVEVDEKDPDCNPANLLMEGVQTADIFSGGRKMLDGSNEMDDHFDAIEDLDIRELTRSQTQTQSIFKADISVDIEYDEAIEEELNSKSFFYDEWDYKSKGYKRNWCSLIENKLQTPEDFNARSQFKTYKNDVLQRNQKEIARLKQNIEQIIIQKRPRNRQLNGPEVDIDAIIDAKADIKSGHTPSPKFYISKRKSPSNISVLILLDASLSSDSWVEGKKVIDIAKESLIVIQEVLHGIFQNTMIASFHSNTRKKCVFDIVKSFQDSWENSSSKLVNVNPAGYTRIGVALRHGIHKLEKVKTKNKIILLLSDGKPTDYDAYEGKLGINDVRQCVREASAKNINIYSLAIDRDSKFYFPQLFGPKNYEVLKSAKTLPEQLIKLFGKII